MSDYTRSRWEQIKAMRPRARLLPPATYPAPTSTRARTTRAPDDRRRAGAHLHPKLIDRRAGGTGYYSAPIGTRWERDELVARR